METPPSGCAHRIQGDDHVETMCEIMRSPSLTTKAVVAAEVAGQLVLHRALHKVDAMLRGCDDMEPASTSWT